ncbi:MAG: hypothetical protein H7336_07755 [Bacteriovorax sp.]|nr:hypothetical protein [Bacteriovorax sp.]
MGVFIGVKTTGIYCRPYSASMSPTWVGKSGEACST